MKKHIQNIIDKIYDNEKIKEYSDHDENKKYDGCEFKASNHFICFRKGNITPNKTGHFVSLWKNNGGKNTPYNINDKYVIYMFYIEDSDKKGIFIFPSTVLEKNKILSNNNNGGKLGFRLYAPWYDAPNKTSKITQNWQKIYFKKL